MDHLTIQAQEGRIPRLEGATEQYQLLEVPLLDRLQVALLDREEDGLILIMYATTVQKLNS
jgi:hypothetical protein